MADRETAQSPDDAMDVYVPGAWQCPRCGFQLSQAALFAQSGEIGYTADQVMRLTGERCPNDGGEMTRVTWRDRAEDNQKWGESLMNDIIAMVGAEHLPGAFDTIRGLIARVAALEAERDALQMRLDETRACLGNLHAMVWGECPSLLDEDSDGDAELDIRIHKVLGDQDVSRDARLTPAQVRERIGQAFRAGYHCLWVRDEGRYVFDSALKPGDPDGALEAWLQSVVEEA